MIGKRPKTTDLVLPKNYELISEDEARNIIGGVRIVSLHGEELKGLLGTAATLGPAAMAVAISGVMTMVGGPAGTIAGTAAAILGGPGLANLCYLVLQAMANGQTLYMDLNMNGFFPVINCGVE